MSGADGNPIVPVDVVQGIVQQLATVSQHTSSATTAMRHLVSEIAGLETEGYDDDGGCVDGCDGEKWEPGSD